MLTGKARRARIILLLLLVPLQVAWGGGEAGAAGQARAGSPATIAVVTDGPGASDRAVGAVTEQLGRLLGDGAPPTFKTDPAFDAGWDVAAAGPALQAALDDPEVDIVLAMGGLVAAAAAQMAPAKPVVVGYVLWRDLLALDPTVAPRQENASWVVTAHSVPDDVATFRTLVPFDTAFLAIDEAYAPLLQDRADLDADLGVDLRVLPLSPAAPPDLEGVAAAKGALLFFAGPRDDDARRRALFERAARRGIPVFSFDGPADVEAGAFATNAPDFNAIVARRVALNLQEIMRGRAMAELPVLLPGNRRLVINAATGARLGYVPDIRTRAMADFVSPEALDIGSEALDIRRALGMADGGNVEIRISERNVAIAGEDASIARSAFLPQVGISPEFFVTDAAGLSGLVPDRALSVGAGMRQMIWDQTLVSNAKSLRSVYEGTEQQLETQRMDVFAATGRAFYDLARARADQALLVDNVRITEANLQLGRLRREVGFSGRDEVLRWEAELAARQSQVVRSLAGIAAGQATLNRIMGTQQTREWKPEVPIIRGDRFPFLDGRVAGVFATVYSYRAFREAMVLFAYENAPELKTAEKGIEAQEYQLTERQRRWYLPDFWLSADYRWLPYRSPDLTDVTRSIGRFAITASYPIFVGGARSAEERKATEEIGRLTRERELARQLVELRTRASADRMEGSFTAISLAETAATAARENFGIVQDRYMQGLVNVTDLLEAQNAAFAADQNLVAAVYEFLQDLVDFQRAIAWFEAYKSEDEKATLARRIEEAIQ